MFVIPSFLKLFFATAATAVAPSIVITCASGLALAMYAVVMPSDVPNSIIV